MRHARQTRREAGIKAPIFFGALIFLMVFSLLLPLRPTFSPAEKRDLAKFPTFTPATLLTGDYFHGIDTWFSDTFPGRDLFFTVDEFIRSKFGYRGAGEIAGAIKQADEIPKAPYTGG